MKKAPPTRQRGTDGRFATHGTAAAHGKKAARAAIAPKKPPKAAPAATGPTTTTQVLTGRAPGYEQFAPSPAEIAERGKVKRAKRPPPPNASESGADVPS